MPRKSKETHTSTIIQQQSVRQMFSRITGVYDFMNRFLSFGRDRSWRGNLVRRLDGDLWEVLDLCAGTGDLALECRRAGKGRLLVAADFCPEMLRVAKRKAGTLAKLEADESARPPIHFQLRALHLTTADALRLPFSAGAFDAVIIGFGIRNLSDLDRGLQEIGRVLRPAGQLAVLDFFGDAPGAPSEVSPRIRPEDSPAACGPSRPVRWYLECILPTLGRLFGRDAAAYSYLSSSRKRFVSAGEFARILADHGYEEIAIERQTLGVAHIVGGRRPL
jgi:ubiquinone/menaquinone biosynthesis methyltransferase